MLFSTLNRPMPLLFHPSQIFNCSDSTLDERERICCDQRSFISISSRFRSFSPFQLFFASSWNFWPSFLDFRFTQSSKFVLNMILNSIFHSWIAIGELLPQPAWCDKLSKNFFISFNAWHFHFEHSRILVDIFLVFIPNNIFLLKFHILHCSSQKFSLGFLCLQIINSFQVGSSSNHKFTPSILNHPTKHRIIVYKKSEILLLTSLTVAKSPTHSTTN